jgi:hypothetical protein
MPCLPALDKRRKAILAVLICVPLLLARTKVLFTPLPLYDFMTYWAAGRLFLSRANPYSAAAILAVERSLGWPYAAPLIMLNPPWALPLAALLGFFPFQIAHYAWLAVSLLLEAVSSIALWRYFGGEKRHQWIALALLATFLPAGTAEHMGQITPLILAGLTAFLFSLRYKRDLLAGACLLVLGLKPNLLYLVFLAILLWAIRSKKWSLLFSAVLAYAIAASVSIFFNHHVLEYFRGTFHAALDTSCGVGGVLRCIFGVQYIWLQFLPTPIGVAWFALYWKKHRREWQWEERLPLVLLVSIGTNPYFWGHDFILSIPAFIALAVALSQASDDWLNTTELYFSIQLVIMWLGSHSKPWMATASLLWIVLYHLLIQQNPTKRKIGQKNRGTSSPQGDSVA